MFIAALFGIAKNWKPPRISLTETISIPCGYHTAIQRDKCWHRQQTTWMHLQSIVLRRANSKWLHTVWSHLYNVLSWQNYRDDEQINGCQGFRMAAGGGRCGSMRVVGGRSWWDGTDCGGGYTNRPSEMIQNYTLTAQCLTSGLIYCIIVTT